MTTASTTPFASMYTEIDRKTDHPLISGEEIFGFYRELERGRGREVEEGSFINRFTWGIQDYNRPETVVKFNDVIRIEDIEPMRAAILNQGIRSASDKAIMAIMSSATAFSEVSRKDFAKAYVDSIQQPQAAALFAYAAIFYSSRKIEKDIPPGYQGRTEMGDIGAIIFGADNNNGRSGFLISGQEFRQGMWASNPLTADEVRALPFVAGLYLDAFAEVEHSHALHAKSVIQKVSDAGFPNAAGIMAIANRIEIDVQKRSRKHEQDAGLGM